jgi:hypothetical protein
MIESEFRDWMRGQLRSLDERIKRLDREIKEPRPREPLDERMQGEIGQLLTTLTAKVKAKEVAGLAIAFVNDEGVTNTGWAADGGYFSLAGAATFLGLEILEEYRKDWRAANDQSAADAPADPAPAEG